jgi:hypothetical protein
MRELSILDRLSPGEAHLPPSTRAWARLIRLPSGDDVLELRDPNRGVGNDPETKPRHQYLVRRGCLWTRRLPPAPLERIDDETPWANESDAPRWLLAEVAPHSPIAQWALEDIIDAVLDR